MLSDRRARMARRELDRLEELVRLPDGDAVAHEQRAASDRVGGVGREGVEPDVHSQVGADGRLRAQGAAGSSSRLDDRAAGRNVGPASLPDGDDGAAEIAVQDHRREAGDDRFHGPPRLRRPPAPPRREEPDARRVDRMVQLVEPMDGVRPSPPAALKAEAVDNEPAVELDRERRAAGERRRGEDAVAHEDAARAPRGPAEVVPVHADRGGATGRRPLHRGHRLAAEDVAVREDGLELVQAAVGRRADDVEDDGPATDDEVQALVGDPATRASSPPLRPTGTRAAPRSRRAEDPSSAPRRQQITQVGR